MKFIASLTKYYYDRCALCKTSIAPPVLQQRHPNMDFDIVTNSLIRFSVEVRTLNENTVRHTDIWFEFVHTQTENHTHKMQMIQFLRHIFASCVQIQCVNDSIQFNSSRYDTTLVESNVEIVCALLIP